MMTVQLVAHLTQIMDHKFDDDGPVVWGFKSLQHYSNLYSDVGRVTMKGSVQ